MRIAQKEKNLEKERERIRLLKEIEDKQKILEKKEVILQKQLENKEQIDEIKASIQNLKSKVEQSSEDINRLTQVTVINKSNLKSDVNNKRVNSSDITEIKEDISKVKRNIEDKLIRNELARQREEEIKKRKYSYFKENQKQNFLEEDKTKLFFDENMIKQSFQKKKQIIESEKSEDFKKKLQKKSSYGETNEDQNSKNVNLLSALNAPTSIVEIKEQQLNTKSEVILFSENEIELGFKHKKNVKEFVKAIIDKQIRVEIVASIPKRNLKDASFKQKQKSRLLYVRTFLINQGISHNRIGIKFNEGNNSKDSENKVVLNFIGL